MNLRKPNLRTLQAYSRMTLQNYDIARYTVNLKFNEPGHFCLLSPRPPADFVSLICSTCNSVYFSFSPANSSPAQLGFAKCSGEKKPGVRAKERRRERDRNRNFAGATKVKDRGGQREKREVGKCSLVVCRIRTWLGAVYPFQKLLLAEREWKFKSCSREAHAFFNISRVCTRTAAAAELKLDPTPALNYLG